MLILSDAFLVKYKGSAAEPSIPSTVRYICGSAFSGCENLQNITLPNGVESIGSRAFEWCRNLQSIHIPESVTTIGDNAFRHCTSLHAHIAQHCMDIGENAFFKNTKLTVEADTDKSYTVTLLDDMVSASGEEEQLLAKYITRPDPAVFREMSEPRYKLPIALCYNTTEFDYLKQNVVPALNYIIDQNDTALLNTLLSLGIVDELSAERAIERAIECNGLELQMLLMRFKHEKFGESTQDRLDEKFKL